MGAQKQLRRDVILLSQLRFEQLWQLGDVRRYTSGVVESHRPSNFGIALVGVAVDISDCLLIGVNDFEAAVYGLEGNRLIRTD